MKVYRRNGHELWIVCIALILAAGCASQNQAEQPSQTSLFLESAKNDFKNLPNDVLKDSKETFSKTGNLTALLLAGGASIAMHQGADRKIERDFRRNEIFHSFTDRSLKLTGGPGFHFAAAGLWYALSAQNNDDFNKERAWTLIRALSVTGLTTVVLKGIRDNETPAGNRWAWPSGHTSSSFAVASVLDEFYGPKVGIPAYVFASLVGLRMMDQKDHWASDVVFGATLGWVVGHTIAGKHKELEIAGFTVLPYITDTGESVIGVNLVRRF